MSYRTIFVCLVLVLVKLVKIDAVDINFKLKSKSFNNGTHFYYCDHDFENKDKNKYTVFEGEEFKITISFNTFVNELFCTDSDNGYSFDYKYASYKNVTLVKKRMGTLWKCKVLIFRDNPATSPVVYYDGVEFTAIYCFMKLHVRPKKAPQTILVNNVALDTVLSRSLEQDIDFTAEYQYTDGELVNVTCANFWNIAPLTIKYDVADQLSNNFKTADLTSENGIGFIAKLNSRHHNTYMTCTRTESTDYTNVVVRFTNLMKPLQDLIKITINGVTVKPNLEVENNHFYGIDYYVTDQLINVVCEVNRLDSELYVFVEETFEREVSGYKNTAIIPLQKYEVSFSLITINDTSKFSCSVDYNGARAAKVEIRFKSEAQRLLDVYPLELKLPSNGILMEVYTIQKLKVIFYEFDIGDILQLGCYPLFDLHQHVAPLYVRFNNSDIFQKDGSPALQTLNLTNQYDNTVVACYLKELPPPRAPDNIVKREIRMYLRKRIPIPTTTTLSTPTTRKNILDKVIPKDVASGTVSGHIAEEPLKYTMLAVGGGACIIIICLSVFIMKLRKRNHSQGGPYNRNYENLSSPNDYAIPASPPQWENNYAVPADQKAEDTTYSVPFQNRLEALYATAVPKADRNKKKEQADPTYAVLDIKNKGQRNFFKETDDANYSEVYANRNEQCYAKVLPKSVRNKGQENNPYANVTNESPYANTSEPEPMYCEPNIGRTNPYSNINNAHYANSPAPEYVEPSYSEPQRRKK